VDPIVTRNYAYHKPHVTEISDEDLVRSALRLLPRNNYEAANELGVSEGTIRRWRRGSVGSLRADTRNSLRKALSRATGAGWHGSSATPSEASDSEVRARLESIEASGAADWEKNWKIVEIAAAYRAKALADLAAALRHEGRVAELRGEAALRRHREEAGAEEESGARSRREPEEGGGIAAVGGAPSTRPSGHVTEAGEVDDLALEMVLEVEKPPSKQRRKPRKG
jgi:hypothetical protein